MSEAYYLGADPGGEDAFGVAFLAGDRTRVELRRSAVCNGVEDAISWFLRALEGHQPAAMGIDTLTYWRTGRSGWRNADWLLRKAYPNLRNSVLSPNGLAGSMSIQGMCLFLRARQVWPEIEVTETHPKVLWGALFPDGPRYPRNAKGEVPLGWPSAETSDCVAQLMSRFETGSNGPHDVDTEDEFDALLSGLAAWKGGTRQWTHDLVNAEFLERAADEPIFPAGRPRYWWPLGIGA